MNTSKLFSIYNMGFPESLNPLQTCIGRLIARRVTRGASTILGGELKPISGLEKTINHGPSSEHNIGQHAE